MAFKHLHTVPFSPLACYHRSDGDIEFMNVLASELSGKVATLVSPLLHTLLYAIM